MLSHEKRLSISNANNTMQAAGLAQTTVSGFVQVVTIHNFN
ncbi:MAG: hypothetical protein ACJAZQ_001848 [Cognaticolwellia sp.]|jgi:hypothetical protein